MTTEHEKTISLNNVIVIWLQETRDLKERLKTCQDIIASLECKIQQLSQGDGTNIAAMLQRLRDATNSELKRYKNEAGTPVSLIFVFIVVTIIFTEEFSKTMLSTLSLRKVLLHMFDVLCIPDDALNKAIKAMRQQKEDEQKARDCYAADKARLEGIINQLQGRIGELEGQVLMCINLFGVRFDFVVWEGGAVRHDKSTSLTKNWLE